MNEQLYNLRLQMWNALRKEVLTVNKASAIEFRQTPLRQGTVIPEIQIMQGLERECTTTNSN